jgi:hypothetical protein
MPVVIKDFEVIGEDEPQSTPEMESSPMPSATLSPKELRQALKHIKQRCARVHAE